MEFKFSLKKNLHFFCKVAKFSPKSIHVGVGDTSRQLSTKELSNEVTTFATSHCLDKDVLNSANPQSALL